MVIRSPFKAQGPRLFKLQTGAFLLSGLFALSNYLILKYRQPNSEEVNIVIFNVICVANIATSFLAISWIIYRFKSETTSKELKIAIKTRYIEFFAMFCFIELPFLYMTRPLYGWNQVTDPTT
jgi:hypothetical protein